MTKVKICGLTRLEDIRAVNRYMPDYIGFVFAENSRRSVTPRRAAELKRNLSSDITAVGVFVNEAKEEIARLLDDRTIEIAQLHGQETEQELRWIKERTGKPVIKAVSVRSASDIDHWLDSCADYLLFDNGAGGTGHAFDWSLITECTKPFFLAGGIGLDNLTEALKKGAYAVDLSGGAETNGQKDPDKIAEIIKMVRVQQSFNFKTFAANNYKIRGVSKC